MKAWSAPGPPRLVMSPEVLNSLPPPSPRYGQGTHHGLAGQLEVGHRDSNLLVVMVPGHNFYHVTLIFGPLSEAELGRVHRALGSPQARGSIYPRTCPASGVLGSPGQGSHPRWELGRGDSQ